MYVNITKSLVIMVLALALSTLAFAQTPTVNNQNKVNDDDVLAEFNGGKITRKDLNDKISKLPAQSQGRYKTIDGQTQILEIMATEDIFYAKALQMNIQSDPIVMDKVSGSKKQFYVQEYYKRNVSEAIKITPENKRKFYDDNLTAYFVSPYLSIYYIQVADEASGNKAMAELKAGTDFEVVSDSYNQNTYAKGLKGRIKNIRLNGHIPGVGNDSDLDRLIDAASADQTKYYGPYNTATGWHIIKVFERVEGRQRPYEEVESEIEQRLRPQLESKLLDEIIGRLKLKYKVVVDSTMLATLDLRNRKANEASENLTAVSATDASLTMTVKTLFDRFEKMSPQEQVFYVKDGGLQKVANQEVVRTLMFLEASAERYEDYFKDDPEYIQMMRYHILQEAFKRLVLDRINVTNEAVRAYYDTKIDSYTTPESRTIQVLWFDKQKVADKTWKKFVKAVRRNKDKDIDKLIAKNSLKPDRSILDNQYNNGIITGIGPDADFSKLIWSTEINAVSPVFTTAKGEIVFFRVLRENPKVIRPFTEVEPRIFGALKKEAEKTMQEQVKEELFREFSMNKYPERLRLLLSAEELFNLADNAAQQRKYKDAMVYYDQIINNYPNNTDDYKAYFMKAFLVAEEMNDKQAGLDLFRAFLTRFPSGELNESAKFMIEELEGNREALFEEAE